MHSTSTNIGISNLEPYNSPGTKTTECQKGMEKIMFGITGMHKKEHYCFVSRPKLDIFTLIEKNVDMGRTRHALNKYNRWTNI